MITWRRRAFRPQRFGNLIFARNKYGSYCIPAAAAHRPACKCVINGDVWEANTVDFMLANCVAKDVITAGAFFGDALPALSRACRRVWAFEPNPESYRCAQMTVLMNDLQNISLGAAGLGDRLEKKRLVVKDHAGLALGGASQIADITDRGSESVAIDLVTIDSVVPEDAPVAIIHLDLEGYEKYALAGAHKTIARCRPLLILETTPPVDGYRLKQQLDEQTYLLVPVTTGDSRHELRSGERQA